MELPPLEERRGWEKGSNREEMERQGGNKKVRVVNNC